jgi:2-hydroxychromene-2-carboxylate isomerase
MSGRITVWFEFASTYSYPAMMRVEEVANACGIDLRWRSMLLGPIFAAHGMETSPFILNPVKGAYMWRDLERICEAEDLPFRRPSRFPRGSLLGARIVCRFADASWVGAFIRSVYTANFARDEDIGEAAIIARLLQEVGQEPGTVIEAATTADAKAMLRDQTEAALNKGIFGAPTFEVGDELFWGHDRMLAAVDWAGRV